MADSGYTFIHATFPIMIKITIALNVLKTEVKGKVVPDPSSMTASSGSSVVGGIFPLISLVKSAMKPSMSPHTQQ